MFDKSSVSSRTYVMHHVYHDEYQNQTIESDVNSLTFVEPHRGVNWHRSWTNTPSAKSAKRPKQYTYGPMVKKLVTVLRGPRLPKKVWSKRHKKFVWARKPIQIYRYVRERTLVKNKKKLSKFASPNYLFFTKSEVSWSGSGDEKYSYYTDLNLAGGQTAHITWDYTGMPWTSGVGAPVTYHQTLPDLLDWDGVNVVSEGPSSISLALADDADRVALTKFYDKANQSKVDLAQALAERNQTAGMLKNAVRRLVGAARDLRRGRIDSATRKLIPHSSKELANDVLAFQFGVKPLIEDIRGIAEELSNQNPLLLDCKSKAGKKHSFTKNRVLMSGFATDSMLFETEVFVRYSSSIRFGSTEDDYLRQIAQNLGFESWAALAWEVTPWSFVFDWVFPLGNYLQNHDALLRATLQDSYKTTFIREKVYLSRSFDAGKYAIETVGTTPSVDTSVHCTRADDVSCIVEKVYCYRNPTGSWMPELPLPPIKDPRSPNHCLDAAALIRQLFK